MKKMLFLILTLAYCAASSANLPAESWVISKDGKVNCKEIRVGTLKAKVLLDNGQKITLPLAQINSYSQDGKIFKRLNVYVNGKPTSRMAFMEQVKSRDGNYLYKFIRFDLNTPYDCYCVYRGDQYYCTLDETLDRSRITYLFKYFGFHANFE